MMLNHPLSAETSASIHPPSSTTLPYRTLSGASGSSRSTSTRSSTSTTNPSLYRQRHHHRRSASSHSRGLARRVPYKRSVLGVYIRHPDISEERQHELRKQQRERESLRALADFLRHTSPPPGNRMSIPDRRRQATGTSTGSKVVESEEQNREKARKDRNRTRRWSAPLHLSSVLGKRFSSSSLSSPAPDVLRRQKKNSNGGRARRSHKGRFKFKGNRPSPHPSTSSSTLRLTPPRIKLPDTAVAGRTTGGFRHIAISIPLEHSQFGPHPRSQYPIIPREAQSPLSAASPPPPIKRTPARHKPRTLSPTGAGAPSLNPVAEAPELAPLPALSRHQTPLHLGGLQPADATAHRRAAGRDTVSRALHARQLDGDAGDTHTSSAAVTQGEVGGGIRGLQERTTSKAASGSGGSSRPPVTLRPEALERIEVRTGNRQISPGVEGRHRRISSASDRPRSSTSSSSRKMELPPIMSTAPLTMTPTQTSLDKGKGKAVDVTPPPSREAAPSSSKTPSIEDRRNRVRELRLRDISAARSQRRRRSSAGGSSSLSLPLPISPIATATSNERRAERSLPRVVLTPVMVVADIQPSPLAISSTPPRSSVVKPPPSGLGFSELSSRLSGMMRTGTPGRGMSGTTATGSGVGKWRAGRISGGSEMTPPQSPKDAGRVKKDDIGESSRAADDDEKWLEVERRLQRLEANKDAWGIALKRVLEKLGPEHDGKESVGDRSYDKDRGLDGWEDFDSGDEKRDETHPMREINPAGSDAPAGRPSAKVWRDSVPLLLRDDDESDLPHDSDDAAGDGKRLSIRTWSPARKSKDDDRGGGTGTPKWTRISPDADLIDRSGRQGHHRDQARHGHGHKHSRSSGSGSGHGPSRGHRKGASLALPPRTSGLDTLGSLMQEITGAGGRSTASTDVDTASSALARRREREVESETRRDNRKGMVLLPEEQDEFTMI